MEERPEEGNKSNRLHTQLDSSSMENSGYEAYAPQGVTKLYKIVNFVSVHDMWVQKVVKS